MWLIGVVFNANPDPNFYVDADPDLDPDWVKNHANPHADPVPQDSHMLKFFHSFASLQCFIFLITLKDVII